MKKIRSKFISLLTFIPLLLTGCNESISSPTTSISYFSNETPGTATIRIYKNNESTSKERYIAPKNVELKYTYNSLSGLLSNNENVCPSIGDVNLLVIPVHLPGGTYNTPEVKSDIEKAFFSKNDPRLGFKSISEYYYESSFGQLNFQGEVTNWFDVEEFTNIKKINQITQGDNGTIVKEILQKAVAWAELEEGVDLSKYDNNKDGSIDGVWLVYDVLDTKTDVLLNPSHDINSTFWNFTSWDWNTIPNLDKPTTSGFSWSSFSMMYTSYCNLNSDKKPILDDLTTIPLDTHVYIHETGHLLGLDDYYASDDDTYHPMGKTSMMDQNICDLDSYSKLLLGWVTPYVVYGTSEILIPTATSSKHGVIVIPTDYEEISATVEQAVIQNNTENFIYEFNPFSEYLLIDLYSPDGLNKQDTYGKFINGKLDSGIDTCGVRIYHVDSRIFKCKIINFDGGQKLSYVDNYVWDGKDLKNNEAILMPISNQKIESTSFQLPDQFDYLDQIRLLEASQLNTFSFDGCATSSTLFTPKTKDFDISSFGYQFFNSNYRYNNGVELPFKINVKTLKEIA